VYKVGSYYLNDDTANPPPEFFISLFIEDVDDNKYHFRSRMNDIYQYSRELVDNEYYASKEAAIEAVIAKFTEGTPANQKALKIKASLEAGEKQAPEADLPEEDAESDPEPDEEAPHYQRWSKWQIGQVLFRANYGPGFEKVEIVGMKKDYYEVRYLEGADYQKREVQQERRDSFERYEIWRPSKEEAVEANIAHDRSNLESMLYLKSTLTGTMPTLTVTGVKPEYED
jgi:hypothetical protein